MTSDYEYMDNVMITRYVDRKVLFVFIGQNILLKICENLFSQKIACHLKDRLGFPDQIIFDCVKYL